MSWDGVTDEEKEEKEKRRKGKEEQEGRVHYHPSRSPLRPRMTRAAAASVVVGGVEEKTEGSRPGQGEGGREGGVVGGGGHGREEWKEGVCRSRCGRYQLFMRSPLRKRRARR